MFIIVATIQNDDRYSPEYSPAGGVWDSTFSGGDSVHVDSSEVCFCLPSTALVLRPRLRGGFRVIITYLTSVLRFNTRATSSLFFTSWYFTCAKLWDLRLDSDVHLLTDEHLWADLRNIHVPLWVNNAAVSNGQLQTETTGYMLLTRWPKLELQVMWRPENTSYNFPQC